MQSISNVKEIPFNTHCNLSEYTYVLFEKRISSDIARCATTFRQGRAL